MRIERVFSTAGQDPFACVEWEYRDIKIPSGKGGPPVFEMDHVEVPRSWSETAGQIVSSKYFRKAGVPLIASDRNLKLYPGNFAAPGNHLGMPGLLPGYQYLCDHKNKPILGSEQSVRQVVHRLAYCWVSWGWRLGYFTSIDDGKAFYDEIVVMLLTQRAAPNSPQWFNAGLFSSYGITGSGEGLWHIDPDTQEIVPSQNAYEFPQVHACFIQSVDDSLCGPGSIMDLWEKEARLFKYGSGTGTNFSKIRAKGEPLNNGGTSAGLMPWLEIGDKAAGAIKSGGTTRRAAKMVCLDCDHPEVIDFIRWKAREEVKVRALVDGYQNFYRGDAEADPYGLDLDLDWRGEAYQTVSGQNSNNSIRFSDDFMEAMREDGDWNLKNRLDGSVSDRISARTLWMEVADAARRCADPGVQFDDTINRWNTCPNDGRINASNPCSEYMFLDNTGCNLASINVRKFFSRDDQDGQWRFQEREYRHACHIWTMVLDISVSMASYPSEEIARGSQMYRTLGLGYANLGGTLMALGIPYDSHTGRNVAAVLAAIMTGTSYRTSHLLAVEKGSFPAFSRNSRQMRDVIGLHRRYAGRLTAGNTEVDPISDLMLRAAEEAWAWAEGVEESSLTFRNAQVTVIAPTGTIALVMDCDTTGIEPDFALVKHKTLAGGGTMSFVTGALEEALRSVGTNNPKEAAERIRKNPNDILGLSPEIRKVFETANEIRPRAHVDMMAAVQPFLSGAISKTLNMPAGTTTQDVADIYEYAWEQGIKALAVYVDGSKASQPLSSKKKGEGVSATLEDSLREVGEKTAKSTGGLVPGQFGGDTPLLSPLPATRHSLTHRFEVAGKRGWITATMSEDGRLAEVFLKMARGGTTAQGLIATIGKAMSIGLRCGVPLRMYADAFKGDMFEPRGLTDNKDIPLVASVVDYVVRWLEREFPGGQRQSSGPALDKIDYTKINAEAFRQEYEGSFVPEDPAETGAKPAEPEFDIWGRPIEVRCPECGDLADSFE